MSYCGPRGIPWSTFAGWDLLSRASAVAWARRTAQTCNTCGTHPDIWDLDKGGDPHALVAVPRACRGCETLQDGQKQLTEQQRKAGGFVVLAPPDPEGA